MASLIKWYIDKKVEKFLNRGKKYRNVLIICTEKTRNEFFSLFSNLGGVIGKGHTQRFIVNGIIVLEPMKELWEQYSKMEITASDGKHYQRQFYFI